MSELLRLVNHPVTLRVSITLLHFLWQGLALAGVALVLLRVLRKASANARYAALLAVLAAMAAGPALTFAWLSPAPLPAPPAVTFRTISPAPAPASPAAAALTAAPPTPAATTPAPLLEERPEAPAQLSHFRTWIQSRLAWISVLWMAGVVVLSLRFLWQGWAVSRLGRRLPSAEEAWQEALRQVARQVRLRRPVRLVTSVAAYAPMVIGWLRPVVVLPASALTGLPPEQLCALLAHELAHIRRCDQWVNLGQTLIELLLFYHPSVWWVSRAIRAEREHCCDDLAVSVCGDAGGYMRALAWVEQRRGAPAPALAATGSSLARRIRRLAGRPTRSDERPAWLAAALALTMVGALLIGGAISRATAQALHGHGLEGREQWQPQTENDPRLLQPVQIEILGRAVVPALAMLSEKTGVSLGVAPEDLETVGERKLTVIAQGCDLKTLMVQIPRALQECHWDVVAAGAQPAYLLHRAAGVDNTIAQLVEEAPERRQAPRRAAREARLSEARRALTMTPEELTELAKTDPLLAVTVKDPEAKARLQLLLDLPPQSMQEFITTGRAYMECANAPAAYQQAAQQRAAGWLKETSQDGDPRTVPWAKALSAHVSEAAICFEDYGDFMGMSQGLQYFDREGTCGPKGDFLRLGSGGPTLPPQFPDPKVGELWYRKDLLKAGYDDRAADALLAKLAQGRAAQEKEQAAAKQAAWREPRGARLHQIVTLPFKGDVEQVEVLRYLAKETGLSLVSDYFTQWGARPIPKEAEAPTAAWRLLYLLGDKWFWTYEWTDTSQCLVFHDRYWYGNVFAELPESMVTAYREKLAKQGRFTFEEVVAAAVELAHHRPLPPSLRGILVRVPSDLDKAGLRGLYLRSDALLLYASLTPKQMAKATGETGLLYGDMTPTQQALVQPYAFFEGGWDHDRRPLPANDLAQGVFHVKHSVSGPYEKHELDVDFPSKHAGITVMLPLAKPPAPAASGKP